MPFLSELKVQVAPKGQYVLLEEFLYKDHRKRVIKVPARFSTDFASIPRVFRWLVTGHDQTRKPAVVHDYLVRNKQFLRSEADNVFNHAMKDAGVPGWKRFLCYSAVVLATKVLGEK